MRNIAYAMAFAKIKGLGKKTLIKIANEILNVSNVNDAYLLLEELCQQYKRIQQVSIEELSALVENAENILKQQADMGIDAIAMGDDDYPISFMSLEDPPLYFFSLGNRKALHMNGIAIIGTRNVSEYGRKIGEHLGKYIALKGWSIISGLAEGCDTSGHVGCLQGDGYTVAIVGTSLEQVYPKSNTALQKEIIKKNGCVISEYPIGTPASPYNFIERDRLQCGLAKGIVVVETGLKGGSYHAINGAIKLHRPVACYKYNDIHYAANPYSIGNQKMIVENTAIPLYDAPSIDAFLVKCLGEEPKDNKKALYEEMSLF